MIGALVKLWVVIGSVATTLDAYWCITDVWAVIGLVLTTPDALGALTAIPNADWSSDLAHFVILCWLSSVWRLSGVVHGPYTTHNMRV